MQIFKKDLILIYQNVKSLELSTTLSFKNLKNIQCSKNLKHLP